MLKSTESRFCLDMFLPIDVATRDTVAFITANVPHRADILEVGCGAGQVAQALARHGHTVTGIDADDECIRQTRALGVSAVRADWAAYDGTAVSAIAFTRSLHHIHPLDDALRNAHRLLRSAGRLILDDFSLDAADETTLDWLAGLLQSDELRDLCQPEPDSLLALLQGASDRTAVWRDEHHHEPALHEFDAMSDSIANRFGIVSFEHVPYLYRYVIGLLPETKTAATVLAKLLSEEARLGKTGKIRLIGRRLVAEKRD